MDPQTSFTPAPIGPAPVIPKRAVYLLVVVILAACGYLLVSAFKDYQGSGVLIAQSPDAKALLSVSQTNHQAKLIGQGEAKVRLPAGSYEVVSAVNGGQALAVAAVKKGQTTKVTLPKNKDSILPSVYSINFTGTDELINQGYTAAQVGEYKEYIFNFKHDATSAAINIDSVQPGPHNPNTDIGFSTTMSLMIDSTTYQAKLTHIGLDDLRVYIYSSTGQQVFDSGV